MRHLLLCSLLLVGCGKKHATSPSGASYVTGQPAGAGWELVDPGGADYAWWNEQLGATIYADSNCGKRYQDASLESLMKHLLQGLGDICDVDEVEVRVGDRTSLLRVQRATLDGVEIKLGAVLLKKNACNHDLVYIAPVGSFSDGFDDFRAVVDGFETR